MKAPALEAVLPLRQHDRARFDILDRSLRRNFPDLSRCWVVTTDAEHGKLQRSIDGDCYRVIPESEVVPEIGTYRRLYRLLYGTGFSARRMNGRFDATGWFIQQLVKLAIAERIESDFYITLDSDVVCMKPVSYGDLIEDGRAVTNTREEDVHPEWYANSERVLGMTRSGLTHGVTPAVLNQEAVLKLHEHLASRVGRTARALGSVFPRGSLPRDLFRSWRSQLLRCTPWTEYSLYHTFIEGTGQFDRYHVRRGGEAIYDNYRSVWFERDFQDMQLDDFMQGEALFLVMQSNTGIDPGLVWEKVRGYLE